MRKINRPSCPNPTALATNYKHPENKNSLILASHGKCMYCESKVLNISFGDIEHIKPKSVFPELEFDWANLGFGCTKCNVAKGNKYSTETPYINPYSEEPGDHVVAVGSMLKHKNGSERGELTINDIDLNRSPLIEKRQARIDDIEKAIDKCGRTQNETLKGLALTALLEESKVDKEYSLFIETLFRLHGLI